MRRSSWRPAFQILGSLCALLLSAPLPARMLGELEFRPCEIVQPGGFASAQAECARFQVAENPQQPQGRRIQLAVTLLAARNAKPGADVVTMLAGGPGQSAVDAYFSVQPVLEALRADRHLLLLDQRGTGNSNRLACAMPDWRDDTVPSAADMSRMAQDCLRSYEGRADARWYTTTDAIRDLEALRVVTGVSQFNLIGGSYGTRVALEYLRRFPQAVRSVVLDGVVPPELPLLQDHARNLDEALDKLALRCAEDPGCKARYGHPLRTIRTLLQDLRRQPRLVAYHHPRTHQAKLGKLTAPLLQLFVRLFSYSPEAMSVLPLLVDEAVKGRPQALMAQVETIAGSLGEQLAHGMELSVSCTEDAPFLRRRAEDAQTVLGGDLGDLIAAQCSVWPRGTLPADFKAPVKSDKPVLILSGELDPVTPPRYGDQVMKTLGRSRHLVARGAGHIAMERGCLPRLVKQFVAGADAAALDASCMELMDDTGFFLGYQGPAP